MTPEVRAAVAKLLVIVCASGAVIGFCAGVVVTLALWAKALRRGGKYGRVLREVCAASLSSIQAHHDEREARRARERERAADNAATAWPDGNEHMRCTFHPDGPSPVCAACEAASSWFAARADARGQH